MGGVQWRQWVAVQLCLLALAILRSARRGLPLFLERAALGHGLQVLL